MYNKIIIIKKKKPARMQASKTYKLKKKLTKKSQRKGNKVDFEISRKGYEGQG